MKRLYILKDLDKQALQLALDSEDSGLILMQDSIYFLNKDSKTSDPIKAKNHNYIYALEIDTTKRGLKDKLVEGIKTINYDQLIDLLFSGPIVINL